MIEDKLTRDERIRLESLNQSIQLQLTRPDRAFADILRDAEAIELWLKRAGASSRD